MMLASFQKGQNRLCYRLSGAEGRPLIILGHSLATDSSLWGFQMSVFAAHFRVAALDMRGHGQSGLAGRDYRMADLADDVIGLADHLGYQRFFYLGLSIGGMIGQELAIKAGARLEGLVLTSTVCRIPPLPEEEWQIWAALMRSQGVASQVPATLARWFTGNFRKDHPQTLEWIAKLISKTPLEGYIAARNAIRHFDVSRKLATITTPTLIVYGDQDPGTPREAAETLNKGITSSRLVKFKDAAHLLTVQQVHRYNEEVLSFLRSCG